MESDFGGGDRELLVHALTPVAHCDGALATATALEPYQSDRMIRTAVSWSRRGVGVRRAQAVQRPRWEPRQQPVAAVRMRTPYVVEKKECIPDKTSIEQSEELVAESHATVQIVSPDVGGHTIYARAAAGANADRPVAVFPRVGSSE